MENNMFQSVKVIRALAASLVLVAAAGCSEQASSPPPRAASAAPMSNDPELAGAWYQIFFDTNKTDIDSRGQMVIKNVAHVATNNSMTRVTVIGKADRVGDAASNIALSQRRADQVRDALIAAGVPAEHIDTRWTGETSQKVSTVDEAAEQRNRVVDVTVIKLLPRKQ
ncbi:MAG: OmpA family protein [Alphaproteobacteria bacterium]|nr:OmpA family protein [Alphaproteobacteria bacterium]